MKHEPVPRHANEVVYFEAEIAAALATDAAFFKRNPGRGFHIRKALPAEVHIVQRLERRLLTPSPGCVPLVLIHQLAPSHRRVIVEAYGLNHEAMTDAAVARLFQDITKGGWTEIEGGSA